MPKQPKEKKESSKKSTSSKAQGKKPAQPVKVAPPAKSTVTEEVEVSNEDVEGDGSEWEDEDDDEDSEGDEDVDVDEAGMAKLMEVLGEDGLDDFAQEQLRALAGSDDEDATDEDDEEDSENEEGEDEGVEAGEEDEEPVEEEPDSAGEASEDEGAIPMDALSDDYVLHPDAMPKQKVEIDNKVCVMLFLNMSWCFLDAVYRSPWSAYAAPLHSIRHFPGRKL